MSAVVQFAFILSRFGTARITAILTAMLDFIQGRSIGDQKLEDLITIIQ